MNNPDDEGSGPMQVSSPLDLVLNDTMAALWLCQQAVAWNDLDAASSHAATLENRAANLYKEILSLQGRPLT